MLGRCSEAIQEGKRACELLPITKDSWTGPTLVIYLASIYAACGEKEAALDQLEISAKAPVGITYGQLKSDPDWDPLRGDPRFEKIVASLAPREELDQVKIDNFFSELKRRNVYKAAVRKNAKPRVKLNFSTNSTR